MALVGHCMNEYMTNLFFLMQEFPSGFLLKL